MSKIYTKQQTDQAETNGRKRKYQYDNNDSDNDLTDLNKVHTYNFSTNNQTLHFILAP